MLLAVPSGVAYLNYSLALPNRLESKQLQPTIHLGGALLKLVLGGQEAGGQWAVGEAIEDEGSFEHVEDVYGRAPRPGRIKILRMIGYTRDRRRRIDREVGSSRLGQRSDDIALGNRIWPVPGEEIDDQWDIRLRDF